MRLTRFALAVAVPSFVVSLGAVHLSAQTSAAAEPSAAGLAIPYESFRLSNGLQVILSRDSSLPLVATALCYYVGSANEEPGRTGLAHLFEHLMFQGSGNVPRGEHATIIEEAGGMYNGWTNRDRTCYVATVPSSTLETVLWLEADRMGWFLPGLTQQALDNERDVVKNERRLVFENRPYGLAYETLHAALYPEGHPYRQIQIGTMADLDAATLEDAQAFFEKFYAPNNATLVIVGDLDLPGTTALVERYFGRIPPGRAFDRPELSRVRLTGPRHRVLEDRVRLPELQVGWPTGEWLSEGDAELDVLANVLSFGRNARLTARLVIQEQIAQSVTASQFGESYSRLFEIRVRGLEGVDLDRIAAILDEEIERLQREGPTVQEVQRAINNLEADFVRSMERPLDVAYHLATFAMFTADPGNLEKSVGRYRSVTPARVQEVAQRYLGPGRVFVSVVPAGRTELQVSP